MDFRGLDIQLKTLAQIDDPSELFELRKAIYCEELGDISADSLLEQDDEKAFHALAYFDNELVGSIRLLPALDSELLQTENEVAGAVWLIGRLMIKQTFRGKGIANLLLYSVSSFLRSQECEKIVSFYIKDHDYSTSRVYKTKPLNIIRYHKRADGVDVAIQLHYFPEIDWMTYKCFSLMKSDSLRQIAIEQIAIPYLRDFILRKVHQIYDNTWFRKVRSKTLTLEQYVDTLGNNLKFVQWTTKILAAVSSITSDRVLRNHYLNHLRGEIDHDLWIEEDLQYLGADVEYYRDHKVPDPAIGDFMNCQESLVSHYRAPIHFMALPLTIEGFTAFWKLEDMESLEDCAQVWGYSNAATVTKFYSSHIHTDGKAEVGHWYQTFKLLPAYVSNEYDISRMYQIASCVGSSINRAFDRFASKKSFGNLETKPFKALTNTFSTDKELVLR